MAASQMLKTQTFVNAALGWIDLAPANILALEPTDKLAKRLSSRLAKAIDACAPVRDKVAKPRSRDARNTIDTKEFDGGALHITTAGAAANLAEIPARYVFCDEVDRMEASVDSEGDPVELAEARATTYEGICKLYHVSSPTTVATSKIAPLYEMGTQESYHVPCPHCGHLHALEPENFRYDYDGETDSVERAWFICPECGAEIEESDKATMLPDEDMGGQARWVATSKGDGETVSFHINAFYAPLGSITWLRLARQHARAEMRRAKGDNSALQVYTNTRLARTYDDTHATTTADALRAKAEDFPLRVIPAEALVVTAATDTQPDRLEVQIEAWGPGMEHWLLDFIVIPGDPSEDESNPNSVWHKLDQIIATPFAHATGAPPIPISAYSIDTGGSNTQDVYNYGSRRRKCTMLKGASRPNRPIISSGISSSFTTCTQCAVHKRQISGKISTRQ
jgi:phage terminase large subunit GpA-like protein